MPCPRSRAPKLGSKADYGSLECQENTHKTVNCAPGRGPQNGVDQMQKGHLNRLEMLEAQGVGPGSCLSITPDACSSLGMSAPRKGGTTLLRQVPPPTPGMPPLLGSCPGPALHALFLQSGSPLPCFCCTKSSTPAPVLLVPCPPPPHSTPDPFLQPL